MSACDIAAVSGYLNQQFLHLPPTSGTLFIVLVSSLIVIVLQRLVPGVHLQGDIERNVDLGGLLDHRWTIGALATVGVLLSVAVVGIATWLTLDLLGVPQPACLPRLRLWGGLEQRIVLPCARSVSC